MNFENHPILGGKCVLEHLLGGSIPGLPITVDACACGTSSCAIPSPTGWGAMKRAVTPARCRRLTAIYTASGASMKSLVTSRLSSESFLYRSVRNPTHTP